MSKNILADLLKLATKLDEAGFSAEAAQLDEIWTKLAEDRKFDIELDYVCVVSQQDYEKHDEPPSKTHKQCRVSLAVRPIEDEVRQDKPVYYKELKARNLEQARMAIRPFVEQARNKYKPASFADMIRYEVG
jgi:hypothetical protein